jgi:hypothetical protein
LAASGRWVADGTTETDRGLMLLHQGMAHPPGPERTSLFEQAEAATVAGLAVAPGQPGPWVRLAWLRKTRGDTAGALVALRLSWLSGAFVPSMMVSRLEFALGLLPSMDPDMKSLLRRQLRLTWVVAPDTVTGLSSRPEIAALVQEALNDLSDDDDVKDYIRLHGHRP